MARDVMVGVDIGGTNTVFGLVDEDGRCLVESSIPTRSQEDAVSFVSRLAGEIVALHSPLAGEVELRGIGVGAPNANYYRGTVETPPNLDWPGVTPFVDLLRAFIDKPVVITNDANAAALGELRFGAARGMRDFIVITLGTGLGSGIVCNGELVYGHDGFAGEMGHTLVEANGRACGCGKHGCLEAYGSASGIRRTIFQLMCDRREESDLRRVSFQQMTAKMISDAAAKGDVLACAAFEFTGQILGRSLADAVAYTSPEAIIMFGGLANAGEVLFAPTRRALEEHVLPIFRGKVKVLPSGLPEGNSAVLGAAALAWTEHLKGAPARG
jgi:glucokinase